jgi:hypothetical protein
MTPTRQLEVRLPASEIFLVCVSGGLFRGCRVDVSFFPLYSIDMVDWCCLSDAIRFRYLSSEHSASGRRRDPDSFLQVEACLS